MSHAVDLELMLLRHKEEKDVLLAALRSARNFAATMTVGYKPRKCDCDPSVGIDGCIVCDARAVIDDADAAIAKATGADK